MRAENSPRLNSCEVPINSQYYLAYNSIHSILFSCLEKYSSGRLLDIGCGNKPYQKILDPFIDEYIGCDIVQSSEHKVDVLCDATDIPFIDESFDTVISTQTIEHVAEHQLLINEAHRLLKRNRYFIISGPMYWPIHEEPHDFFRFTNHGFKYILHKAGFSIEEERANGGKWALCGQSLIHALYPLNPDSTTLKLRGLMVSLINKTFDKLDKIYHDPSNTMSYVFVARK